MNLSEPSNICIKPWYDQTIDMSGCWSCCGNVKDSGAIFYDEDWKGPYVGDVDHWNSPEMQKFRKDMLEGGASIACGMAKCPQRYRSASIGDRILELKQGYNIKDEKSKSQIAEAIENNRLILDYSAKKITYIVTMACNSKCAYCFQISKRKDGSLNPPEGYEDHIIPILTSAKAVRLAGGEVFVLSDKKLDKFFGHKDWENVEHVCVVTNGTLLTPERYEKYAANGPLSNIEISLNTMSAEEMLNETEDMLFKCEDNMRGIYEKYPDHCVTTLNVAMSINIIDRIDEVLEFVKKYGIKEILIHHINGTVMELSGVGHLNPYCKEGYSEEVHERLLKVVDVAKQFTKENGIGLRYSTIPMSLGEMKKEMAQ